MRLSLRWVGVLTTAALIVLALWPENRALRGPQRILAQDNPKVEQSVGPGQKTGQQTETSHGEADEAAAAAKQRRSADVFRRIHEHPLSSDAGRTARIESALDETVNFKIEPQSFREALQLLAGNFHIPILIDQKALDDANVDTSQEVKLNAPGVTLRETLELLLSNPASPLGIEIRHGTLMVSTIDQINEHMQVVVYDCRDLAHCARSITFPLRNQRGPRVQVGAVSVAAWWVVCSKLRKRRPSRRSRHRVARKSPPVEFRDKPRLRARSRPPRLLPPRLSPALRLSQGTHRGSRTRGACP
jgi:hypothetical protein